MDHILALVTAGAFFSAIFLFKKVIKLVFVVKNLLQVFELLHWAMETDYTPVGNLRRRLIITVKLLFSELFGSESDYHEEKESSYNAFEIQEHCHAVEICDDPPQPQEETIAEQTSIGRRTTRRVVNARLQLHAFGRG
ncbi:hypothetical protein Ocin01_08164 [Orchesella cincta]|uniref:Uncharacterized protein n=1 Tax=Orchesella cincta TaxID=48709 RepID=A0A1D2MZN9_ORCCI|nr:hypothetical protein Ocin01_08164 [Orchesella cincta]